jgi:hypothetical protein
MEATTMPSVLLPCPSCELNTHCVVAADSPHRDLAIRSKQVSGKARCSSKGTLATTYSLHGLQPAPDDLEAGQGGLLAGTEARQDLVEPLGSVGLGCQDLVHPVHRILCQALILVDLHAKDGGGHVGPGAALPAVLGPAGDLAQQLRLHAVRLGQRQLAGQVSHQVEERETWMLVWRASAALSATGRPSR